MGFIQNFTDSKIYFLFKFYKIAKTIFCKNLFFTEMGGGGVIFNVFLRNLIAHVRSNIYVWSKLVLSTDI